MLDSYSGGGMTAVMVSGEPQGAESPCTKDKPSGHSHRGLTHAGVLLSHSCQVATLLQRDAVVLLSLWFVPAVVRYLAETDIP